MTGRRRTAIRRLVPAALATGLALGLPAPAWSQALCSAPHSSPHLAGGGSIGTLAPGTGWVQLSGFRQRSTQRFGTDGERLPFPADGRVGLTSLYLTAGAGLLRGVDAWAQVPLHVVGYRDAAVTRSRTGIGDFRAALRVGPELFGAAGIPLALRAGVKLPGSAFPLDATIIPLTEGQRDWEVSLESGHAFAPAPVYLLGWIGYRWREENTTVGRRPGAEVFTHAALGGTAGTVHWELAGEFLYGSAPRLFDLALTSGQRRLWQLTPTVGRRVGPGDLEATGLVPIRGRNLPTGAGVSLGYRLAWGHPQI